MNEALIVQPGVEISWVDRRYRSRKGMVLSTRTTPRTGKRWAQVQVIPGRGGGYAGQTSVKLGKHVEVIKSSVEVKK